MDVKCYEWIPSKNLNQREMFDPPLEQLLSSADLISFFFD